jgi:hypothetical protein
LNEYGPDKKIFITNGDDYTHVILLNTAMPSIPSHIPKSNVIGFAFEPPRFLNLTQQFVDYAKRYIGRYYIGELNGLSEPFVERYSHMWYNPPLKEEPIKTKIMSLMVSEKMDQLGHTYRHQLVNKILETNLPIDIYGRGCRFYSFLGDDRVKGEFSEIEPYEYYDFHVCIENIPLNHYFSEKIMNPLLTSTTPVYLGCRNIDSYFKDSVIVLTGNINRDMDLLNNICREPEKYKKAIDVQMVKDRIYLLNNVDELFSF